jgi:hypothetical protein
MQRLDGRALSLQQLNFSNSSDFHCFKIGVQKSFTLSLSDLNFQPLLIFVLLNLPFRFFVIFPFILFFKKKEEKKTRKARKRWKVFSHIVCIFNLLCSFHFKGWKVISYIVRIFSFIYIKKKPKTRKK